ncbi:uncharacterized protein LOC134182112 [Corticium candelabrum]|uniref:uncharacterized protein LOC134182112 n=1 Tax=Corticium candelabrum TaxID=121492 RepID=UPI002E25CFC4|nr:uncharacterized protein LOC134182112 [Corticium candelabrum]
MSGHLNGCQAKFQEKVPKAAYYHCASHQPNLAISKSSTVPDICCMLSYLKAVGDFFKYYPKRQLHLETTVSKVNVQRKSLGVTEVSPHKVRLMCETRWVERHTILVEFAEMHEPIVNCFETISRNSSREWNAKSVTKANELLKAILSDQFIAAFQTNLYFFVYTKPLSCLLQCSTQDILTAYKEVDVAKRVLKDIRADSSNEYDKVYVSMCTMAKLHGMEELTVPRTCSGQSLRSNIEVENPKTYWRCTTSIPFLDHLIAELSTRFSQLNQQAIKGLRLLPCNLTTLTDGEVAELYKRFHQDLPAAEAFEQEVKLQIEKWKLFPTQLPDNICETLQQANDKLYPNICTLLKLLLVIPVTTASVERGNSSLKYIKSELRTTMLQDRLNALILLFIH